MNDSDRRLRRTSASESHRARPLARSRVAPARRTGHRRAPAAAGNHRRFPPSRAHPLPAARDVRRPWIGLSRVLEDAPHPGAGLRLVGLGVRRAWRAQLGGRQFSEARSTRCGTAIPTRSRRRASPPNGTAEAIAGGYRLSGRWGFASGCDHAQWICSARREGLRHAAGADVPRADQPGRDRRRLARHGSVRHGQQVDRRQGRRWCRPRIRSACTN